MVIALTLIRDERDKANNDFVSKSFIFIIWQSILTRDKGVHFTCAELLTTNFGFFLTFHHPFLYRRIFMSQSNDLYISFVCGRCKAKVLSQYECTTTKMTNKFEHLARSQYMYSLLQKCFRHFVRILCARPRSRNDLDPINKVW